MLYPHAMLYPRALTRPVGFIVFCTTLVIRFLTLAMCTLTVVPYAVSDCVGPREVREVSHASIQTFILSKKMTVLTFTGYSGAEYQDPRAMLAHAARVLDGQDPSKTLIDIGATAVGIGAVYEIAKQRGFTTMGIVSKLARDEQVTLSKCVDYVFYVPDTTWGGLLPGTNQLSPTSASIVAVSGSFVAIGGGDVTKDEALAARAAGKRVTFIPADMNHEIAIKRAQKRSEPEPTDFRGSAHAALAQFDG